MLLALLTADLKIRCVVSSVRNFQVSLSPTLTNPVTSLFFGSGRNVGRGYIRVNFVLDRFREGNMEQETDVLSLSCQGLEGWEAIQGRRGHVVEENTHILEAEKPGRWRATRGIHDLVDPSLGSSPLILSLVLVLMVWVRLVISNKE